VAIGLATVLMMWRPPDAKQIDQMNRDLLYMFCIIFRCCVRVEGRVHIQRLQTLD
jgi:hypothetical protein